MNGHAAAIDGEAEGPDGYVRRLVAAPIPELPVEATCLH
jgi:hypothetical protein